MSSYTDLYDEDGSRVKEDRAAAVRRYNELTSETRRRIRKLEPMVHELMKKPAKELTAKECDVVSYWRTQQQDLHTWRRRLFMTESCLELSAQRERVTKYERRIEELEDVGRFRRLARPWTSLGDIWRNEVRYQAAVLHGWNCRRLEVEEGSRDPRGLPDVAVFDRRLLPTFPWKSVAYRESEVGGDIKGGTEKKEELDGPSDQKAPSSVVERIRSWCRRYGALGFVLYGVLSVLDISAIYFSLKYLNLGSVLAHLGLTIPHVEATATIALTYALHKMLLPVRAAIVFYLLPRLKPHWDRLVTRMRSP